MSDMKEQFEALPKLFEDEVLKNCTNWECLTENFGCSNPLKNRTSSYKRTVKPVIAQNLKINILAAGNKGMVSNNAAKSCNAMLKQDCSNNLSSDELVDKLLSRIHD